jgi:hypothetical protein
MHRNARRVPGWLLGLGVVLLLPKTCQVTQKVGPTVDDVYAANAEVVRLPLHNFDGTAEVEFSFRVPDSPQWARIRRSWGDPGYMILGVDASRAVLPFEGLGLDVTVSGRQGPLPTEPFREPLGLFVSGSPDIGLRIRPTPGDIVTVRAVSLKPGRPVGDLVVAPCWTGSLQDRADGTAIVEEVLEPLVAWSAVAGILLVAAGAILVIKSSALMDGPV